eukprot:2465854-Prymnesium_polylepis.1
MSVLRKALASKEEEDSDVYFVLKSVPQQTGRPGAPKPEREIAQGHLNLRSLVRDGADLVAHSLPLRTASKGGASLVVSLFAFEALRRVKVPMPAADGVRIEVGELSLLEPLKSDPSVEQLWVEIDALELNGPVPLRTNEVPRDAPSHHFGFAQLVQVADGSAALEKLVAALAAADEQEADIYFALKSRGPQGDKEVAQGFVNLKAIEKAKKDHELAPIDLVTPQRSITGKLNVAVTALETIK